MSSKKALFEDDDTDEDISVLKVNKKYAENYDKWRIQEELQAFKGFSDIESESSSEESSEDEACMFKNPQYMKDYYLTLGALENKDPEIKEKVFFKDSYDEPERILKEKPLRLAEYQRKMLIEKNGELSDEEDTDDDHEPVGYLIKDSERTQNDEPKTIGFDDDNISDDEGEMFTETKTSKNDVDAGKEWNAADEVTQFLKGNIDKMRSKKDQKILQPLRNQYNRPDIPEEERWLNNFFLDQANAPDSSEGGSDDCIVDEESISGDEETFKKMQEFDTLCRFRYEEDNEDLIKNYPRLTVNSVRIKENKRRKKRNEIKDRKKREKEEKIREYRKLKALELAIRLKELKKSAGFEVNLEQKDLDGMFDSDMHSKVMDNLFNDEYYAEGEDEEKPVFDEEEDIYGDYDEWLEKHGGGMDTNTDGGECSGVIQNRQSGNEQVNGVNNHYDNSQPEGSEVRNEMIASCSRKRRYRKSKFTEALLKRKPTFNPEICSFEKYYEKHYGLECEDFIGDMPVKYKYRNVPQNNYGLSTSDILQATDGELNQWVSWKKVARYQRSHAEEKTEFVRYKIKSKNEEKMKHILPSLFEDAEAAYANEEEKKKIKYEKKKARKQRKNKELKKKRRHCEIEGDNEPPAKRKKVKEKSTAESSHESNSAGENSKNKVAKLTKKLSKNNSKVKLETKSSVKSSQGNSTVKTTPKSKGEFSSSESNCKSKLEAKSSHKSSKKGTILKTKLDIKSSKKESVRKTNLEGKFPKKETVLKTKLEVKSSKKENVRKAKLEGKSVEKSSKGKVTNKSSNAGRNNKLDMATAGCSKNNLVPKKNKEKSKIKNANINKDVSDSLAEGRLGAYILNPKKAAKKIKYGNKNNL